MKFKLKETFIFFVLFAFCQTSALAQKKDDRDFEKQLLKNLNIDWSIYKTDDYRWRNFGFGSGYSGGFEFEEDLSWKIGLNLNWSKYTLYNNNAYEFLIRKSEMKLTTISIPATIEYQVYKSFFTGFNLYTGPVFEQVLFTKSEAITAGEINHAQFGWTLGARLRFLALFSFRVSYDHYFTGLFVNGDLNRSAVRLSLGF